MHPQIAKHQRKIRSSHSQTNHGALSCHSNDDSLAPLCTEMKMARLSSVFSYFPRILLNSAYPQGPTWRPCPGEATRWVQSQGFPGGSGGKEPACHCRRNRSNPQLGRSFGGGHSSPLQYFCLENSMDRGAWRATVHGIAKSQTWLKRLEHACTPEQTAGTLSIAVWPLGTLDLSSFLCQRGFIVPIPVGGRKD